VSDTAPSPPAPHPPAPAAATLAQAAGQSAPPSPLFHSGQYTAGRSAHIPLIASPLLPGSAVSFANPHIRGRDNEVSVFYHDVGGVRECGAQLFAKGLTAARQAGVNVQEVDWIVPYQANSQMRKLLALSSTFPKRSSSSRRIRLGIWAAHPFTTYYEIRVAGLQLAKLRKRP
jgi:hypothetical protein